MSYRLRLLALLALVATALSACVVVPVPERRAYYGPPVYVTPYPYYYGHHRDRW